MVMLHMKLNGITNALSANSVLTHILDPWGGVKGQHIILMKIVMLLIKSVGMEPRATCKHIFCPYTQPRFPRLGSKD